MRCFDRGAHAKNGVLCTCWQSCVHELSDCGFRGLGVVGESFVLKLSCFHLYMSFFSKDDHADINADIHPDTPVPIHAEEYPGLKVSS